MGLDGNTALPIAAHWDRMGVQVFANGCRTGICQTACKPGSVPPPGPKPGRRGRPFLWGVRCRTPRATDPGDGAGTRVPGRNPTCRPYLVLLPVGFAVPPSLPKARCALTAPFHPYRQVPLEGPGRRYTFCGTVPEVALAGRYPAPRSRGARTFLHPRAILAKDPRTAAVQPSGARTIGGRDAQGKLGNAAPRALMRFGIENIL